MSAAAAPKPIDARAFGREGGLALKRAIMGTADDDRELATWLYNEDNPPVLSSCLRRPGGR